MPVHACRSTRWFVAEPAKPNVFLPFNLVGLHFIRPNQRGLHGAPAAEARRRPGAAEVSDYRDQDWSPLCVGLIGGLGCSSASSRNRTHGHIRGLSLIVKSLIVIFRCAATSSSSSSQTKIVSHGAVFRGSFSWLDQNGHRLSRLLSISLWIP